MSQLSRWVGAGGVLLILVASVAFAALNGGQRVTLRLGIATFYRIPLTAVAFGSLILGMVVMLAASIHSDLKVRRILRERLAEENREERERMFVDQNQKDLFERETGPAEPEAPELRTSGPRASEPGPQEPRSTPPSTPAAQRPGEGGRVT